jgi:hypothetical protein
VRRNFVLSLADVMLNHFVGVDGNAFVRVKSNAEQTRVSVNDISIVTELQVVHDSRLVQVRQGSAVISTIETRRVHGVNISLASVRGFLTGLLDENLGVVTLFAEHLSGVEGTFAIRNPDEGLVFLLNEDVTLRTSVSEVSFEVGKVLRHRVVVATVLLSK